MKQQIIKIKYCLVQKALLIILNLFVSSIASKTKSNSEYIRHILPFTTVKVKMLFSQ